MFHSGRPREGEGVNPFLTLKYLGEALRPTVVPPTREEQARIQLERAKDELDAAVGTPRQAEKGRALLDAIGIAEEWMVISKHGRR